MNTMGMGNKRIPVFSGGWNELMDPYPFFYTNQRGKYWRLFIKHLLKTLSKITRIHH